MRKTALLLCCLFWTPAALAQEEVEDLGEEITAGEALDAATCRELVAGMLPRIELYTRMRYRRRVPVLVEPKAQWERRLKAQGFAGETAKTGLAFYNIVSNAITIVPWTIGGYLDGKPDKLTRRTWLSKLESILIHELTHALHHQNFYVVLGGARQASLRKDGLSDEELDESTVEFLIAEGFAELVAHRTATPVARTFLERKPRDEISGPLFFWDRYQPDGVSSYRTKLSRFGYQDGMNILHILTKKVGSRGVRALLYRRPPRELFFQPDRLEKIRLDDPPAPDDILGFLSPDILKGGEIYLAVNPGAGRFFPDAVKGMQRARAPGCLVGYATEVGEEGSANGYSRFAFFVADPDKPGTWSQEQAESLGRMGPVQRAEKTLPLEKAKAQVMTVELDDKSRYVRAELDGLVVIAHESKPTRNLEQRVLLALRALYIKRPTKGLYAQPAAEARAAMGK